MMPDLHITTFKCAATWQEVGHTALWVPLLSLAELHYIKTPSPFNYFAMISHYNVASDSYSFIKYSLTAYLLRTGLSPGNANQVS